jgi:Na+-driven multidrug efflux pump
MAVAFAAGPIAGQNFGARRHDRVRETFAKAVLVSTVIMATLTLLAHWRPELMVGAFTKEPEVREIAGTFLKIISWNFVAQGIIFTCSSMFQGLGNTRPALLSTATRLVSFAIPAIYMSSQPGFQIHYLWYLSVATVTLQAIVSFLLLRREFRRRLVAVPAAAPVAAAG